MQLWYDFVQSCPNQPFLENCHKSSWSSQWNHFRGFALNFSALQENHLLMFLKKTGHWYYTMSRKRTNSILGITLPNTDQFSKFFHFYNLLEIFNKVVIKLPIAPKMRHYEGRSKSFEPDYLPLDFWAKKCYWPLQRSLISMLWKNLVVCLFTLQDIMY